MYLSLKIVGRGNNYKELFVLPLNMHVIIGSFGSLSSLLSVRSGWTVLRVHNDAH